MLAILPVRPVETWGQDHQHVRIREPVLLPDHGHHEVAIDGHGAINRHQSVALRSIEVHARGKSIDIAHQHVGFHRMQSAARRYVLLQEHQIIAFALAAAAAECPLQHLAQQGQRQ